MGSAIRVLLVENPVPASLAAALEQEDDRLRVVTAGSANTGLTTVANRDLDCVISGSDLPDMSGVGFLERVREDDEDLPFIIFTGEGSEEIASKAISAGVSDYIRQKEGVDQSPKLANRIVDFVERGQDRGRRDDQHDITNTENQIRDLGQTERLFEAAFNTPVAFAHLLDADGTIRRVNRTVLESGGSTEEDVVGEKVWNAPWFSHAADTRAKLQNAVERAADGEHVRCELSHRSTRGGTTDVDTVIRPVRDDGEVVALLTSGHDITEREEREQALREAYEVMADPDRPFPDKVDALLELGREIIGTDYATFSCVNEDLGEYEFERLAVPDDVGLEAGDTVPLDTLPNCARVVETRQSLVLHDVAAEAPDLMDPEWGICTYLGAPVMVGDEVYGTFCFYDMESRSEDYADWESTFVDLLSNWVGHELQRQRHTDRLTALNHLSEIARDINRQLTGQSTREEIEQVVCERLTASDSYEFAWIAPIDDRDTETIPTTAMNTREDLDTSTLIPNTPSSRAEDGSTSRSGVQVMRNVELPSQLELEDETGSETAVKASASIPITYEDRHYGVLHVYTGRENAFSEEEREVVDQLGDIVGLAIAAVEHERELEYERERLEFVNRLLRHNLLNDLNTIRAQTTLLEADRSAENDEHLATIRERIDDMVDLLHTLRSLMQVIIEDDDHELEPVDLGDVLRDELRRARQTFDRAKFEIEGDLSAAGVVMADDLLATVFENLLANAVQHNDKEVPRVSIDAETSGGTATVRVADNGPGIPEDLRQQVFQKGEKSFKSPGTGFGLYLAREVVEAYDGRIAVNEADTEGAAIAVSIPLAC